MIISRSIGYPNDVCFVADDFVCYSGIYISSYNVDGGTHYRDGGMVFRNMYIPQNSIINSASITFNVTSTKNGTPTHFYLCGESTTNPSEFSTYSDYYTRNVTSGSVLWENLPTWYAGSSYYTPDLSAIIQEIVNRSDWVYGNGISLFWRKMGTEIFSERRYAEGWNSGSPQLNPSLSVDFTIPKTMTMRVSLPGYDALTDGTVDHYALYADQDNVLIKEFTRGTMAVAGGGTGTISHNLGYSPIFMGFAKLATNRFQWIYGNGFYNQSYIYASTANIFLVNKSSGTITFKYYVFYDKETV